MNYDQPIYITYTLLAASLIAAADLDKFSGPKGKTGRVVAISAVNTTGVTVADSSVVVGDGTTANKYAEAATPISAVDAINNTMVDNQSDANLIPADAAITVGSGGGATAGAANISVTVAWF